MSGVFKLTNAEFKKIFKKPSVFIMAILLVITVFISLYTFNPTTPIDNSIKYNANTALEYYNIFIADRGENSKSDIDATFQKSDELINYYSLYNERNQLLDSYYNEINLKIDNLKNKTSASIRENAYNDLKTSLNNYRLAITSFNNFSSVKGEKYAYIEMVTSKHTESGIEKYDYLFSPLNYVDKVINLANTTTDIDDFLLAYNLPGNTYISGLETSLKQAKEFIQTTFSAMSSKVTSSYSIYETNVKSGSQHSDLLPSQKNALKSNLEKFKKFFNLIVDNDYPLILLTKQNKEYITTLLDESLAVLDMTISEEKLYLKHKAVIENLVPLNIVNSLGSFTTSGLEGFRIDSTIIDNLVDIQNKTKENQTILLDKINNLKTDTSTQNISFAITEYSMLANAFVEYSSETILNKITSTYDKSEYSNFYGKSYENYNEYEHSQSLALNEYYIKNNTYANSYLSNFSIDQKSDIGDEPNLYDFMFFSLELCTLIITIFATMLICSLITGETESGTIKLMLVRPYRRGKIITAKLLATLYFVFVFMLLSIILTYTAGSFVFARTNMDILAIFNAQKVFEISPLALILLDALTLLLDIIFYVIFALMVAILFKSYPASITAVLFVIIANYALNILFAGLPWYNALPGMNLHLFRYFGNGFIIAGGTSIITQLFATSIYSTMNIGLSLLINTIYIILFTITGYRVFAKRDF